MNFSPHAQQPQEFQHHHLLITENLTVFKNLQKEIKEHKEQNNKSRISER
jgi:hypothetical protein